MTLFFLFFCTLQKVINLRVTGTGYVTLPEYGIEKDGKISFMIKDDNHQSTIVFLAWKEEYLKRKDIITKNEFGCLNINNFFGLDTITFFTRKDASYTSKKSGIKVPIVAHCRNETTNIIITYNNPGTYLDLRNKNMPIISIGFSYLYLIFSLIWIFNMICFNSFQIPLPVLFCSSCILRAISYSYESKQWLFIGSHSYINTFYQILYTSLDTIANTILLASCICAFYGWGVFRAKLTMSEYFSIFFHSFIFYFCSTVSHKDLGWVLEYFSFFQSIFSIFKLSLFIIRGLNLLESIKNSSNDPILERKMYLAEKFWKTFIGNMFFFLILKIARMTSTESWIQTFIADQCFSLLFSVIAIDSFLIRGEHDPSSIEISNQLSLSEPENIAILEEPTKDELAFLV